MTGPDLEAIAPQYFLQASAEVTDPKKCLQRHFDVARSRMPGELCLRVDRERRVVDIVFDDMPLLVESVTALLTRLKVGLAAIIHPVFKVSRDSDGVITEFGTGPLESWIHLELFASTTAAQLDEVEAQLATVLGDVRRVDDDAAAMQATQLDIADALDAASGPFTRQELDDCAALMRWLASGNYTLLGYCKYRFGQAGNTVLEHDSSLGLMRSELVAAPIDLHSEPGEARPLLVLTRGVVPATVHRSVYPYFVAVALIEDGRIVGEHLFVGVLTVIAMFENVLDIPVIERRVRNAITQAGFALESFSGQSMLELIQSLPRPELFASSTEQLVAITSALANARLRRQVRLFLREDHYTGFVSCLVYLPRDRFSTRVRLDMQAILLRELDGIGLDFTVRVSETDLATVYVTIRRSHPGADVSDANRERLEQMLSDVSRTWQDQLASAGDADLAQRYADAFPESYKHDFDGERAVNDIRRLEALTSTGVDVDVVHADATTAGMWRFTLYVAGEGISLSRVLPILQSLGVEVLDEQPYRIGLAGWIYDFGLRVRGDLLLGGLSEDLDAELSAVPVPVDGLRNRFADAFRAMWFGDAEIDTFNELVLKAGTNWREVAVLRAYARYLRQAGFPYSQGIIARMLLSHAAISRRFVDLFIALFEPGSTRPSAKIESELANSIDNVVSLDADRILRAVLTLIRATLRTNYFRSRPVLSFKLEPRAIAELPKPRPMFEIFVYSPRVEGVHLRFGPVARGGLRWSDRQEDFRTEVLGLVKAQAVKNAVIVPVGAKGGFVVKRPPAPTGDPALDRQNFQAEGIECYRRFVSGLLDLTDNVDLSTGATITPPDVVRRDGDDTYLVVAADKGTATFSDIANSVAQDYGFWLGDAFASGGSAGYDHKVMGITARGAWEAVKRHFRELDLDTQTQEFTVAGVGDMSGDVFGNGMLLSRHIRLVAAFDHRHIFLDPDPEPARSFAERERLFALPRSSWADYNTKLISRGGGVWERTLKSVPLSPEARAALGLPDDVVSLSPPELVRAILLAPVDLLWNGGIGTYVKASTESNADVGDKSNDAVRVNGRDVRARVIGEGGNLGVTARGRIEFSQHGGRINTDALDNSAGVDCSDHEVNIKILLDAIVSNGELAIEDRNPLLASMTDEVAALVLQDNISQNTLMGISRYEAAPILNVHRRMINDLEQRRGLDRELEALPTDAEIVERIEAGLGLTSPELSNLMAHVKLGIKDELLASDLPTVPVFAQRLPGYFPDPLQQRFRKAIRQHPLRREILATVLANDMVDNAGISYVFRLREEAIATTTDAVRAYTAAAEIFGLRDLWVRIRAGSGPTSSLDALELESKRCLDRASRWLLSNRPQPLAVGAEIQRYRTKVADLTPKAMEWMGEIRREHIRTHAQRWIDEGVQENLALDVVRLLDLFPLLDIIDLSEVTDRSRDEVGALYYALDARLGIDRLLTAVTHLERGDRWHALARLALRDDLYSSLRSLTVDVMMACDPEDTPAEKIADWESTNQSRLLRARSALAEIFGVPTEPDLATLSVAARQIRSMVSGAGYQEKQR
ncbi:MAG: NAD-glutamate dehydrogenase [Nocardiaceae bacterium]|nr:NAD-glutamate dehydrogenase [Nocardiaceae bacterium]